VMYSTDNVGYFPAVSRWRSPTGTLEEQPADFAYWQQPALYWLRPNESATNTVQQDQDQGTLVPYMGNHFSAAVWTCPADDPSTHKLVVDSDPSAPLRYPFSYTMNYFFDLCLAQYNAGPASYLGAAMRMVHVRHPSSCVMVLEEGPSTVNDGCTVVEFIDPVTFAPSVGTTLDYAAVRHGSGGRPIHLPDNVYLPAAGDFDNVPNPKGMSNAAFADGHAETVTRDFIHSPALRHWDPLH
jgi:prepilin-type processing-associated H-X9-DG protein